MENNMDEKVYVEVHCIRCGVLHKIELNTGCWGCQFCSRINDPPELIESETNTVTPEELEFYCSPSDEE